MDHGFAMLIQNDQHVNWIFQAVHISRCSSKLTLYVDRISRCSSILDVTDFEAEPVARIHLPVRVPYGFHGSWVPEGS
jgi:hypothetical protein